MNDEQDEQINATLADNIQTAGGLIVDGRYVMLVRNRDGYNLPKGHIEKDETPEQTAVREVREETGLETVVVRPLGLITRESVENSGETVIKDIHMFLMRVTGEADGMSEQEEESEWVNFEEALERLCHIEEVQFLLNCEYLFEEL